MPTKAKNEESIARSTYTVEQAAEILQVNPATIYRLIARRHLRAVPGIRVKRILHSELARFAGGEVDLPNRKAA